MDKFLQGVGWVIVVGLCFMLITPLMIMLGWFTGVLIKFFCGDIIATGMNLLFNTKRFTPEIIPYITATLSALHGYFVTRTTVTNN